MQIRHRHLFHNPCHLISLILSPWGVRQCAHFYHVMHLKIKNIGSYLSNTQSIQCMICNNCHRILCVCVSTIFKKSG